MFGARSYIKIAITLAILSAAGLGYMFVTNMQKRLIEQTARIAQQEGEISRQAFAIAEQQRQDIKNQEEQARLNGALQAATTNVSELRQTLSNHNLTRLAIARPDSIERIINDGTNKIFNDLEQLTSRSVLDNTTDSNGDDLR